MVENEELRDEHDVSGSPQRGLTMATFAFFAGLTTIVLYGVAGPTFEEALGISSALLGLLLSSLHISKILL
jgi:NNP family nitrate/nitrite transporter-like MFS transporter